MPKLTASTDWNKYATHTSVR